MERDSKKNLLKLLLKISLTGLALYVVIQKIDVPVTTKIIFSSNLGWLLLALLFFNISKVISAYRYLEFLHSIELYINKATNLKLYYVGMFYNLFLPGGIGGDGYKVYLFNKYYKKPVKQLISVSLLDRVSGLVALVVLALFLIMFIDLHFLGYWINYALLSALILVYPVYYIIVKILFLKFRSVFLLTNGLSLGVQLSQLICAYFILRGLSVNNLFVEYQALFLLSSIVAVLPFTIGGVGARELVFVFSAAYLSIDKNVAVAFSIIFFLITAFSSFAGIFVNTSQEKITGEKQL